MKRRTYIYTPEKRDDFGEGVEKKNRKIPSNYKYIHTNIFYRSISFLIYYLVAIPVLYLVGKLFYRVKVKNRKVLKQLKNTGYFIYSNHTLWVDGFSQHIFTARPKRTIVVSLADTFVASKGLAVILGMLGAFPLPGDFRSAKNFLKGMEYYLNKNYCFVIYPEGTIWPYYTKQRPVKPGSFKYPRVFSKPVVFACTTYRKPKGLFKHFLKPGMTITLSEVYDPSRNSNEKFDEKRLEKEYVQFIERTSSDLDNYSANDYVPKQIERDYLDEAIQSYNIDYQTKVDLKVSEILKDDK